MAESKKRTMKPATRPRSRSRKPAADRSSGLTRLATTVGAAFGRTERAARIAGRRAAEAKDSLTRRISALTKELESLRKKTRPADGSRLTQAAVVLGTALGRAERAARHARRGAADAKKTAQKKIAALAKELKAARAEFKRAASRSLA
jgi:hypothetical protein